MPADMVKKPRTIPPNRYDPEPLFTGDAFTHVLQGRLFGLLRRPSPAGLLAGTMVGALIFDAATALAALAGLALALTASTSLYSIRYVVFAGRNRRRGTLCPRCTSRMWQFCCARCREPVPALAFFWRGALLASCPHCGFALSSRGRTLLAWCSTCSHAVERPHEFYASPTHVIVAAVERFPEQDEDRGGWMRVRSTESSRLTFFHPSDGHSASLLLVLNYRTDDLRFDPLFIGSTRLLLISENAPAAYVEQLQALMPGAILERIDVGVNSESRVVPESGEEP